MTTTSTTPQSRTTTLSPLPPAVHNWWLEHYHQPFVGTAIKYREQFPERRAAVDLPIFLYAITPAGAAQ